MPFRTRSLAPIFVLFAALSACSASGNSGSSGSATGGDGGAGGTTGANTGTNTGVGSTGNAGVGGSFVTAGNASSSGSQTTTAASSGSTGAGGACGGGNPDTPVPEACGNGLDDDLNGFIDEVCGCSVGQTQSCFGGLPSQATDPNCTQGVQTCEGTAEFHGWGACVGWACGPTPPPAEICYDNLDNDCDGLIDEGCELQVGVNIDGDCVFASCPPQAPFPVGCNIIMDGGDSRGCVAGVPTNSTVYFKEGDKCPIFGFGDAGHVSGTLLCSTVVGAPLNDMTCPINKATKFYPPDPSGCP